MTPRRLAIPTTLAGVALAALLGAPPAFAAVAPKPAPVEPETFFESVDVSVVNVEVYVNDRTGKRVHGLHQGDFQLFEDGQPITLSNFYSVEATEPATTAATPAPATAAETPAASPPEVPEEQRLYLTVFLDERSLSAPGRNRILPAIRTFLAGRLRPGDRLLLATYDGRLHLLVPPTADPLVVNAALEQVAKTLPRGNESTFDRRRVLNEISQAVSVDPPDRPSQALENARETYDAIRLLAQSGFDEVRGTLDAVGQFVESLSGLPGRKAVLLVSGGLAQRPGDSLYQIWQVKFARFAVQLGASGLESFHHDTTSLFERLAERANASRVTFYTLAVPEDVSGRSAEFGGLSNWTPDVAGSDERNQSFGLTVLAAGTGGLAVVDAAKSLLARLAEDADTYYSLGYVPSHRKDGKKHRLEVKLRDPGLAARWREAYRERTGSEATSGRTLSALLLGEQVNPFGLAVSVETETRDKKGNYLVTLLVKLPMAKIVLVPRGSVHEGRVRLYIGARDTAGNASNVNEVILPIRVPNDQLVAALNQHVASRVNLEMRPGEHRLAVGARDELGNTDSTVLATYTAGSQTGAGNPPNPLPAPNPPPVAKAVKSDAIPPR